MKIYYAGALFSLAERNFNTQLTGLLRLDGHDIFLSQENKKGKISEIFTSNRDGVKMSQICLAIVDGSDADSGTCWEIGYAYAQGKKIVLVRTDFRMLDKWDDEIRPINLMMYECADEVIEYYGDNISILASNIDKLLTQMER